ncbi:MAG: AMP-binding protein [Treponema sp.]|nr:AMP-binding protein [Treponema sp.]MCL2236816.1 AMP-binding protein [Treponema sp.]
MNEILSRYLPRIEFDSYEDFYENYSCKSPDDFNFAYDVVDEWARLQPEKIALVWTNDEEEMKTFTFTDIKRLSDKAANALLALGIKKGDVVKLILKQRLGVWILMTALSKIGAICIPGTYQLTAKDLEYRCSVADVKLLITVEDKEILDNIALAKPNCPKLEKIAVIGKTIPGGYIDMKNEIEKASENFTRIPTVIKDPMLIYFSSGTTGLPKMVIHNHSLPLGHIVTAKYWHCAEDNGIHLTQTDSGWAKFAWGKIYGQWICGAAIGAYDTEKFTPKGMLDAIMRLKPVTFCAPATVFRYLIKEDLSGYDFSFIKHTSMAGEPLSPEVLSKLKELTGLEIREGFGQSETSVMAAVFKWLPIKPGSMGKPAPLFNLKLIDEDGEICDEGITGNMSITSAGKNMYEIADGEPEAMPPVIGNSDFPGLFRGYWRDKEVTEKAWKNGTYQTGDLAWRDDDGYLWFVGRNDDVIKCSGYRIGPFEVESALMEHPSVLECAVTAAPDAMRGQVVKATIVLARGYEASDELIKELQNHVKHVTAPYKYPRIIDFVNELPKTISGKIKRMDIRKKDFSGK